LLFRDVRLPTPDGLTVGWLETAGAQIAGLGAGPAPEAGAGATTVDAAGQTLLPGFVDVHTHGALGFEVMDADVDGLVRMAGFLARHGVTSFLPTTWTGARDRTLAALESIAKAMRRPRASGTARILGAHMEGPYLNPVRAGAQDPAHMGPPEPGEPERFLAPAARHHGERRPHRRHVRADGRGRGGRGAARDAHVQRDAAAAPPRPRHGRRVPDDRRPAL
jgi:N-acetylglucosamine-6-phosphate deacetylase